MSARTCPTEAWHFATVAPNGRWATHHGGLPVVVGETLVHGGPVELFGHGLHASSCILDAIRYANGPVVCRVELGGKIVRVEGGAVAQSRRVLWAYDASRVLRRFARREALDVIHRWDAPTIVRSYLESGADVLRTAAKAAAMAIARASAEAKAEAEAEAEAEWRGTMVPAAAAAVAREPLPYGVPWDEAAGAAAAAANKAPWTAAWEASFAAAKATARAAVRDIGDADWDAVWAGAHGATTKNQAGRLTSMLCAERYAAT